MKRLTRWAVAGALLMLALPMAAEAKPWHSRAARAQYRAMVAEEKAQGKYMANYNKALYEANWSALRAQQNYDRWLANHSYSAVPYMASTAGPDASYAPSYAAVPSYGASPLTALMAPVMSGYAPSAAYAPTAAYAPSALPGYYGAGYHGYAGYYPNAGGYAAGTHPFSDAFPNLFHNAGTSAYPGSPITGNGVAPIGTPIRSVAATADPVSRSISALTGGLVR